MAAPPVVVKSSEVAAEVVAIVIAEVLKPSGLTTAVCPAAQLVRTNAQAGRDRNRSRFLVGEVIHEE